MLLTRTFIVALLLQVLCVIQAGAQDRSRLPEGHSPRGALWRAAAIPGWGQIYNRQYYKVPIVYAGLGGLAASALLVNREYLQYRHAFLFIAERTDGKTFPQYKDDYDEVTKEIPEGNRGSHLASLLQANRDNLRRNRDLLYIGVGLFYGLSILDAYVSAHLLDFDVSEDLSLSVYPAPGGFAASVHFGR